MTSAELCSGDTLKPVREVRERMHNKLIIKKMTQNLML